MERDHPLKPYLEQQANRIERVAQAHRIGLRVQGGVVTPRLIKFHLATDPRALSRSGQIEEDFALALGVPSARICRRDGILCLEVPRPGAQTISLVRLQAGIPALPPNTCLLGRDEERAPLLLRLGSPEIGHVLVSGVRGAGKTNMVRTMLTSLALANPPDETKILTINGPQGGLKAFDGLPHLFYEGAIEDPKESEKKLTWLAEEISWREDQGVRTPKVVIAIDDVDHFLQSLPSMAEPLTIISTRGRETGIHLILTSEKPEDGSISGLLNANMGCRIVGRADSASQAVAASGIKGSGAERLLGGGDFLLAAAGGLVRFQAGYTSIEEISVMTEMLQEEEARLAGPKPAAAPAAKRKIIPFPSFGRKRS